MRKCIALSFSTLIEEQERAKQFIVSFVKRSLAGSGDCFEAGRTSPEYQVDCNGCVGILRF